MAHRATVLLQFRSDFEASGCDPTGNIGKKQPADPETIDDIISAQLAPSGPVTDDAPDVSSDENSQRLGSPGTIKCRGVPILDLSSSANAAPSGDKLSPAE
jgi:hypothetical protein